MGDDGEGPASSGLIETVHARGLVAKEGRDVNLPGSFGCNLLWRGCMRVLQIVLAAGELRLHEPVPDQKFERAAPGFIGFTPQIRLRYIEQFAGPGVANPEFEILLHHTDFPEEAKEGHVRSEIARSTGLAPVAFPQPVLFDHLVV